MFHVKQSLAKTLTRRIKAIGIPVPVGTIASLTELLAWLGPAAGKIGLTRHDDPDTFAEEIALPALDLVPHIPGHAVSLAEVGPGSGGAGLTVAVLCPHLSVHLLDRRTRVCAFLDVAAARFDLTNVSSQVMEIDDPPADIRSFDVLMARAVAPPAELLNPLANLTARDGIIALYRTHLDDQSEFEPDLLKEIPTSLSNLKMFLFQPPESERPRVGES
jgi:16S rRNA (guanine527-N7)-methyltransferase